MGMQEPSSASVCSAPGRGNGKSLPDEDVLDILRLILRVEPLDVLLQKVVDTIAGAFNVKRVSLGVLDEKTGLFCPKALHGYPPERSVAIKRHAYTLERMKNDLRQEFRIGRGAYYIRSEDQKTAYDDEPDYIMNEDLVDVPRASPSDWHELDYIDFVMTDRLGNWIGWIEIDEPSDRKVPSKEVIDKIQILADLAAIAIENSKTYEDAVGAMMDSQGYLDLIVHDIGNMVGPLMYYMNGLSNSQSPDERSAFLARNASAVAESIRKLVENVRKFSEVKSSEPHLKDQYDLHEVLKECADAVKREFPTKTVNVTITCPERISPIMADELIRDLFMNLLSNSVKHTPGHEAEIGVRIAEGYSACTVRIEDKGRGIPDDKKEQVFARFAQRAEGVAGTGLGLSIVSLLVERYNGLISVKGRVPGDCSQGACFEVSFPKLLEPDRVDRLRVVDLGVVAGLDLAQWHSGARKA